MCLLGSATPAHLQRLRQWKPAARPEARPGVLERGLELGRGAATPTAPAVAAAKVGALGVGVGSELGPPKNRLCCLGGRSGGSANRLAVITSNRSANVRR